MFKGMVLAFDGHNLPLQLPQLKGAIESYLGRSVGKASVSRWIKEWRDVVSKRKTKPLHTRGSPPRSATMWSGSALR